MHQLELNNRIAAVLTETENRLREIIFEGARTLAKDFDDHITLPLDDGLTAAVNAAKGYIQIAGQHVGDVLQLLKILDAMHFALGTPVPVPEAPPAVKVEAPTESHSYDYTDHAE